MIQAMPIKIKTALIFVLVSVTLVAGCRLEVNRMNKRLARWNELSKSDNTQRKVEFARESLIYFLSTPAIQRGRETTVSDAERHAYHHKATPMQVFLIDYYASQALESIDTADPDWKQAEKYWNMADTLLLGKIPGHPTIYSMLDVMDGYKRFLTDISADGRRYGRLEASNPGLMGTMKKLSEYRFKKALMYKEKGMMENALHNFLLVFQYDTKDFAQADEEVEKMTGKTIREIHNDEFNEMVHNRGWKSNVMEIYSNLDQHIQTLRKEMGDSVDLLLPEIARQAAPTYSMTPEQLLDLYLYTKNERDGTLPQYLSGYRYLVLEGQDPVGPQHTDSK